MALTNAAAELRASQKIEKYAKMIEPGSHFIPIVMETYGRMSNSTNELLRKLLRMNEARYLWTRGCSTCMLFRESHALFNAPMQF
jgi:hypothetical protein